MSSSRSVELHDLSKFYGEVLGVNGVTASIPPGITASLGPTVLGRRP